MYKLFQGFKPLGKFVSIRDAKQYPIENGLTGVFNLIGDNYRDSWYISQSEIKSLGKDKKQTL
ncbi:MAG: hypothetical protein LIP06_07195 [Tannerellaceae bacterium]|nr:hypothetical protein [Tannerellaceae bacterium]